MHETMSISTGLYSNLDLWNENKLHYITYVFIVGRKIVENLNAHVMNILLVYSVIVFL